jgi:SAM-dependent methyltransferase
MMTAVMRETIPYPGKPYIEAHPDRLAVVARLFGLETADVAACRVLEAGCGDGTNLIAMASVLPGSEFVGIDSSGSAISRGRALAEQAGLKNVTLIPSDLCEADVGGRFDYVIAHGVYSWVPARVRDRLMGLCAETLAANGVAMVSYAVYPGGFLEQLIRAPMLFGSRQNSSTGKIEAGRAFARMVVESTPGSGLGALYKEEWVKVAAKADGFVLHDHLLEDYQPVYFSGFVRDAVNTGLQSVADANLGERGTEGLAPAAAGEVRRLAQTDRIAAEQCLDMVRSRRFRHSILCRAGRTVLKGPDASRLSGCFAAAPPYLSNGGTTGLRAMEAAWPRFVSLKALRSEETVLGLFAAGKVDVRTVAPPADGGDSAHPCATKLARLQAGTDRPVTNLLHHGVDIEDRFARTVLALVDGRRTREALVEELARRNLAMPETLAPEIDRVLAMLGNQALLIR